MRKLVALKVIAALAVIAATLWATAGDSRADGFLSNLNPFASKPAPTPKAATTGSTSTGVITPGSRASSIISVPQLGGKSIRPPAAQPAQPSLLSRMGSSTANFFSKTKQMFTPSKPAPTKVSGGPGSSTTTPKTVTQFIGQPRP
jgi:hypothetical protein